MQLYWLYSVFNSRSVLEIFLKSHGVLSILQKRGSICPNYFTFFILRIYQWYSNIPFILNTKNLLFVIKENIPTASASTKMYMKLPWIDISKEFCQLEWENHLIAGCSHTRNSSEVFPVHNGHTICSKFISLLF